MIINSTTYQPITPVSPPGSAVPVDEPIPGSNADRSTNAGEGKVNNTYRSSIAGKAEEQEKQQESGKLTAEEKKRLRKLKRRDREVRRHEEAHMRAGGTLVKGGPQYEYVTGPDGKRYAINGYVNIDVSPEKEPKETVQKADRIIKTALAPAEPSSDDYAIASNARRMKSKALQDIRSLEQQDQKEKLAEQAYNLSDSLNPTDNNKPAPQGSIMASYTGSNLSMTA